MFICDKNYHCCNYEYADRKEDLEEEARECEHLIEVEEVRHGKWVLVKPRRNGRNATYKCTVCNQLYSSYYNDVQEWTHCPCGAIMDKEKEE